MDLQQRAQAFLKLSRFTGLEVSSQFLRQTGIHFPEAGIPVLHNLAEGIFKPKNANYALTIWSRSAAGHDQEIYPDIFRPQRDGTWTMEYSAKSGSLDSAINKSLFACMRDSVPVLVIVTSQPAGAPGSAQYKILGPAIIEHFDSSARRFSLRGCSTLVATHLLKNNTSVEASVLHLRNQLIMPFQVKEERSPYETIRLSREKAFRQIILEEYRHQCAVCQSKFLLRQQKEEPLIEAEAAHIIPVKAYGPDDPRNGLSLCKRHHWTFDIGLFTITDVRTIKVSPIVLTAERRRFDLEEYEGESQVSPSSKVCIPSVRALHWHQKRVFRSS